MSLNTSLDYDNIDFSGLDEGREDNMYSFRASLTEQITSDDVVRRVLDAVPTP